MQLTTLTSLGPLSRPSAARPWQQSLPVSGLHSAPLFRRPVSFSASASSWPEIPRLRPSASSLSQELTSIAGFAPSLPKAPLCSRTLGTGAQSSARCCSPTLSALSPLLRLNCSPPLAPPFPTNAVSVASPLRPYLAALFSFLHYVRVGLPWAFALFTFAHLPPGRFCSDCRIFCTPFFHQDDGFLDSCLPLCDPSDSDALTLFFSGRVPGSSWQSALRTLSSRDLARPRLQACVHCPLAPRPASSQTTSA